MQIIKPKPQLLPKSNSTLGHSKSNNEYPHRRLMGDVLKISLIVLPLAYFYLLISFILEPRQGVSHAICGASMRALSANNCNFFSRSSWMFCHLRRTRDLVKCSYIRSLNRASTCTYIQYVPSQEVTRGDEKWGACSKHVNCRDFFPLHKPLIVVHRQPWDEWASFPLSNLFEFWKLWVGSTSII